MTLLSRHSTCGRSILKRPLCRNCLMKTVWRRECIEPCNSFYLLNNGSIEDCMEVLRILSYHVSPSTHEQSAAYVAHIPKTRKRSLQDTAKIGRLVKNEQDFRLSLHKGQGGTILVHEQDTSFLSELGDELDRKDAYTALSKSKVAKSDSPPLLSESLDTCLPQIVSPCPQRAVAVRGLSSVGSISVGGRDDDDRQFDGDKACAAYEDLLSLFLGGQEKKITCAELSQFSTNHPLLRLSHSMLSTSVNLTSLFNLFGIEGACHLLVKPVLNDWLQHVKAVSVTCGAITVSLGFFVAPSEVVYSEFYSMSTPQSCWSEMFSQMIERDFQVACTKAKKISIKPILIAYHGMFPIPASNILPLGVYVQG